MVFGYSRFIFIFPAHRCGVQEGRENYRVGLMGNWQRAAGADQQRASEVSGSINVAH